MKIAYVILHYMAERDTIECAHSILNATVQSAHDIDIVIVDNGSPNDSYDNIEAEFRAVKNVKVIKSESNLGFAKGNNIGFSYAKHQLGADFIVMLNNDTILSQKDFNEKLVKKFEEEQYSVLGPDIVTADGFHQNPGMKQSWGLIELAIFRLKKRIRILLSYIQKLGKTEAASKDNYPSETLKGDVKNTILHGACWIFSPLFVKRFEGICPDTFLYMEEDILKLWADSYDFLMMYTSELSIYHKEDVSTNMIEGTIDEKIRRKYKRLIDSSIIYSRIKRKFIFKKKVICIVSKVVSMIKSSGKYEIDMDMPFAYLMDVIFQRVIMLLRGVIKSIAIKKHGKTLFLGKNVRLKCKSKIQIGTGTTIQDNVYIDALSKNGFRVGNACNIGSGTIIRCSGNYKSLGVGFQMGNNSSLADNCFVGATGGVWIGDNVIGGQNIRFHASNHNFKDTDVLIKNQGVTARGIYIGNDCWIGAGVVFCDGVTVGNGCVIGSNAVITKSFGDNCIIAGVPAKVIGQREAGEKREY